MASVQKHGKKWRAQIAIDGVRRSKILPTKLEARDWAAREEYLIRSGEGEYGPGTLGDLFERYARNVSPSKRGARWEIVRLEKLRRDPIAKVSAKDLRPGDFADWRDRRLAEVSSGTVLREMNLLSSVMSVAVDEWGVFPKSPMLKVRKPKAPPVRDRLVTEGEIERLRESAKPGLEAEAVRAFEFACASGMRAGEILSARLNGRIARIPMTKSGVPRDVPLSKPALELFGEGFTINSPQLDTAFRRVRDRAKIEGLTFHDSRHKFVTDASKKLDILALARVVGHTNLDQLRTYYSETVESLADRLDD